MSRVRAGVISSKTKEFNREYKEIQKVKDYVNIDEYAGLLYEFYKRSPIIDRNIATMMRRYPNLKLECYEMERDFMVRNKVEKEIIKEYKKPNNSKLMKEYENK